jgi:hypothetical protein
MERIELGSQSSALSGEEGAHARERERERARERERERASGIAEGEGMEEGTRASLEFSKRKEGNEVALSEKGVKVWRGPTTFAKV